MLAAAGAGKGQFYHYFSGRDELDAAAMGHRCAQVVAGLAEALGGVSSLAGLEEPLAGFVAEFEQAGMPGCPIGTLAAEVAGRNEDARLQAAARFDAWERLLAGALERMRERGSCARTPCPPCWLWGCWPASRAGWCSARPARTWLRCASRVRYSCSRTFILRGCQPSRGQCRDRAERRCCAQG
ncbi:MAG TPA: TetR/AcrR family transcriptional regulator [Streptosporangiaceae bacterium]